MEEDLIMHDHIGQPTPLIDGREKVTGRIAYTPDLRLPGMLHARLVLSPYAHARIRAIDKAVAKRVPGVVEIFTAEDLPNLDPAPTSRAQAMLAWERVIFQGQPVAVVLAQTEAAALDGAEQVRVDYEPLPAVIDLLEAMAPEAPVVWPGGVPSEWEEAAMHGIEATGDVRSKRRATNITSAPRFTRGDVEQGFREADVIIEKTYRTSMVHQSYLEPQATVAAVDPLGHVTIWTSTQAQFYVRTEVAKALNLSETQVRVVPMPVGGAFGGKFLLLEPLVATLAWLTRQPVRLVLTRSEDLQSTVPAPQTIIEVRTGARRDGTLTALQARLIFDSGAWPATPVSIACNLIGGYYRFPHLDIQGVEVLTHKPAVGAYRAPGAPQATFAIESQMDELARALALDPIEFRLRNACDQGDLMPNGKPWPKIGLRDCLERMREHPAWQARETCGPNEGIGIAVGGWPGGREPAAAICQLNGDGTLSVHVGSIDITGTHTGFALIAAETFGVEPSRVRIVSGDSDAAPYAGGSGGSKITYTVGVAVLRAAAEARRQVLEVAADYLEAHPDDLEIRDGWVQIRGGPEHRVSLAEIGEMTREFGGKYEPIFGHGRSAQAAPAPGFAAELARVWVDPETGEVRLLHFVAIQDVGRAINPLAVEGQIHGGVAQSIGWGLIERMVYDETGQLLTGSLMDYALPKTITVPPIEVEILEVPAPDGPFGARGVGEPPVVPGAAAIANAIRDAVGVRVTELPVTPERLYRRLRSR